MSFYSFIVLEVRKEVYNRLFNYWVTEHWENYCLHRPENSFDTGNTSVMTFVKNRAPYIDDIEEWLSFDLGMDFGDFYIEMYPETYAFNMDEIEDDEKKYYTDRYDRRGNLEHSFMVTDWEKIDAKEGITFTPHHEIYRRPEPADDVERRLDDIEKTLREILDVIRSFADNR